MLPVEHDFRIGRGSCCVKYFAIQREVGVWLFFRPAGGLFSAHFYPRPTPLRQAQGKLWAAFLRRFAAFLVSDCREYCSRTNAPGALDEWTGRVWREGLQGCRILLSS